VGNAAEKAAVEGLLLRETELDVAVRDAAFGLALG